MASRKILYVCQEIMPYLPESELSGLCRRLAQAMQERGNEIRTFMPRYGCINERRNQLHEVIRLSGINLIISETDHPLLIKVASIQSARIQIYFIDNDVYFHRRKGLADVDGVEFKDNDERSIFFARGTLETVKKLRWTPDVIYCSGWMAALVPLYVKKAYADTPFFENAKVIISLDDNEYKTPFGTKFVDKLLINGMLQSDVRSIAGLPVGYEDLMRLAIDYADALVMASPTVNQRLYNYAHNSGKIILPYSEGDERNAALLELCNTLCDKDDIE